MKHATTPSFWESFHALPPDIRKRAESAFALLKKDPRHPSLHFKKVRRYFSARVGLHHRALGIEAPDGIVWFWIGDHGEYDRLIGRG